MKLSRWLAQIIATVVILIMLGVLVYAVSTSSGMREGGYAISALAAVIMVHRLWEIWKHRGRWTQ